MATASVIPIRSHWDFLKIPSIFHILIKYAFSLLWKGVDYSVCEESLSTLLLGNNNWVISTGYSVMLFFPHDTAGPIPVFKKESSGWAFSHLVSSQFLLVKWLEVSFKEIAKNCTLKNYGLKV